MTAAAVPPAADSARAIGRAQALRVGRRAARMLSSARFATDFRGHVTPSLKRLCEAQGMFLALGLIGFQEAFWTVIRAANDRGASHLSTPIFDDLEDWICSSLVAAAASHEAAINDARLMADRVAKQSEKHFAALSAQLAAADGWGSWDWNYLP